MGHTDSGGRTPGRFTRHPGRRQSQPRHRAPRDAPLSRSSSSRPRLRSVRGHPVRRSATMTWPRPGSGGTHSSTAGTRSSVSRGRRASCPWTWPSPQGRAMGEDVNW